MMTKEQFLDKIYEMITDHLASSKYYTAAAYEWYVDEVFRAIFVIPIESASMHATAQLRWDDEYQKYDLPSPR